MYSRRHIISNKSYTHVFFRCHNRQFLFESPKIKAFLLSLWAKYKRKYGVKIIDFAIMENHAHLLLFVESVEQLGHFMRTVNSQLARFINKLLDRDSQAIRERYKSPLITGSIYLYQVMQYIWLNRYKVNKQRPETDIYCSASWRINPEVIAMIANNDKEHKLLSQLLDSYDILPEKIIGPVSRFVMKMLNAAISQLHMLNAKIYENSHTIGDDLDVRFRGELLSAFRREYIPLTG